MSVWTVKPESVKVDLVFVASDGETHHFWVSLKKKLNVGEEKRVQTAGWRGMSSGQDGGVMQIDWQKQTFARAEAYVTDWSLADDDGKKLPVTREVIETLNADVYKLIEQAIQKHVEDTEEEKKRPSGATSPSLTSA